MEARSCRAFFMVSVPLRVENEGLELNHSNILMMRVEGLALTSHRIIVAEYIGEFPKTANFCKKALCYSEVCSPSLCYKNIRALRFSCIVYFKKGM